jgi:hypothetical protein
LRVQSPYGPHGWDASLGIRAEDWLSQIDSNTFNASTADTGTPEKPLAVSAQREDRFDWGPFLRVKVPFGN